MKNTLLIFVVFGLFSCTEKKPANNFESNQNLIETRQGAQMKFESETHDFGKVKSGEVLSFSFIFSNDGNEKLIISKVEVDCGCLQVTFPEKPVLPGKTGILDVRFNSAGMIGRQLKTLQILSNSKVPKHLIIFAEVENELFETIK